MRRAPARGTARFALAALLMLLLALLTHLPGLAGPRAAVRGAAAPLEAAATWLEDGAGSALAVLGDVAALRAENARLRAENAGLRRQAAELSAAGSENRQLRGLLDFERTSGHRTVSAAVVGRGPDPLGGRLTIDRGAAAGIRPGMAVVTGAGLLGRVGEVSAASAWVRTAADPEFRVNAYTASSDLQGTVSGGGRGLAMTVVPRPGTAATTGEWVLTSGVVGGFPRGLVVGRVTRFERRDAAASERAEVAWVNQDAGVDAVAVITDFRPA